MEKLIQTEKCSIIYGEFKGKENQELFRCPRELDNIDLKNYINDNRVFLGFEDDDTEDVRVVDGMEMINYYRLYFSEGWYGRWMGNHEVTRLECHGVDNIIRYFRESFPKGCNWEMEKYFQDNYTGCCDNKRFLVRPLMSDMYKVMVDTTYGNGDYPVRIYVYRRKENE